MNRLVLAPILPRHWLEPKVRQGDNVTVARTGKGTDCFTGVKFRTTKLALQELYKLVGT